jgi:hypothetical protein
MIGTLGGSHVSNQHILALHNLLHICTLRHIRNRNKSWKPECVLSFNMGWRILVNFICQSMLKLKTHSGFQTGRHDIAGILLRVALKHQKSINQSKLVKAQNTF